MFFFNSQRPLLTTIASKGQAWRNTFYKNFLRWHKTEKNGPHFCKLSSFLGAAALLPRQGLSCGVAMFPFEILRLPRFVHRNLPCSATTGGTTRSPSVILAQRRAQILRLPAKSALNASHCGKTAIFRCDRLGV